MAELRYERLPSELLAGALQRYIEHGIPPGSFLMAVVCNDLREACGRADDMNRHRVWEIVSWLWNEAPAPCWGSPEKVDAWIAAHERAKTAVTGQ